MKWLDDLIVWLNDKQGASRGRVMSPTAKGMLTISAVVKRADGTIEDLGVIAKQEVA